MLTLIVKGRKSTSTRSVSSLFRFLPGPSSWPRRVVGDIDASSINDIVNFR